MNCLGIDTSNYTTSCALFGGGAVTHARQLLPVKAGERGIRQSDAVFHHTAQLAPLLEQLLAGGRTAITAVGASARPRDAAGSYMPCFTVGMQTARALGAALQVPVYSFSHQAGHIAAGLFSAERLSLLRQPFYAFHVSGGTTELLLVRPDPETIVQCSIIGQTEDLNAGQVIDRTGVRLGLRFPCGRALEQLALQWDQTVSPKICVRNGNCSLSGLENQCADQIARGIPAPQVARYCFDFIGKTLEKMVASALEMHGELPLLFVGGVMSNSILRARLAARFDACFASPEFSSDNAAGIAVLAGLKAGDAV